MSYEISKELFKAVMKDDIFNNSGDWGQLTEEKYINKSIKKIDYNDFFFKCKELAYKNDYILISHKLANFYRCGIAKRDEYPMQEYSINSSSEQQAVFNACQWILDNKDKW